MTAQEAINVMEKNTDITLSKVVIEAHNMAIEALEKQAEYKSLEEQGLLLRLPCKVGSTVYLIKSRYTKCTREDQEFNEYSCQGCEWLDCDSHKEYYIHTNKSVSLEWIVRYSKDIGKDVFLTKEEAEAALEKMKGEEHE